MNKWQNIILRVFSVLFIQYFKLSIHFSLISNTYIKATSINLVFVNSLFPSAWWRHQMETFSVLLAICAGNSPVTGEFPTQRPVTRSFDVFFDLRLNKQLSKQSWGWWFETPLWPLCRHCNGSSNGAAILMNVASGNGFVPRSHYLNNFDPLASLRSTETHMSLCDLVMPYCLTNYDHQCFRQWLFACSIPSLRLSQW